MQNAWEKDQPLSIAISSFTFKAKKWNVEIFGNLFLRKRRVLARFYGVQKALANYPNDFLVKLEKQLTKKYSIIKLQEKGYWALKSRLNWAAFGDCNTFFFHVSMVVRRNRNIIRCIKNPLGEWVSEEEEIKNLICNNFLNIFSINLLQAPRIFEVENFSCAFLSEDDKIKLNQAATYEEIKAGLWGLKPFKAPGIDGLHAGFFQLFWNEVSRYARKWETFLAQGGTRVFEQDSDSLIPKYPNLESINNYRPISLCNSIYKIVTKVNIARLRPFLSHLISLVQAAFVPGRRGLDNIIIA